MTRVEGGCVCEVLLVAGRAWLDEVDHVVVLHEVILQRRACRDES